MFENAFAQAKARTAAECGLCRNSGGRVGSPLPTWIALMPRQLSNLVWCARCATI